jgi:UDP-N-acetylglucosamine 1-carboxyvinyltransferase
MVIAAASAQGRTNFSQCRPGAEVDDLIAFLNKMGAKIQRTEPRTIVIEGVSNFCPAEHQVMFDRK